MCTVTWLPVDAEKGFLTSNRDEAPHRATAVLRKKLTASGETILYPADPHVGGSWIAFSDRQRSLCLLNGARRKHKHRPPYRKSRGLVLLDAFEYPDFDAFIGEYPLKGIEPFTLILITPTYLQELVWNGRQKVVRTLDKSIPHIWSSSTLYPYPVRDKRRRLFRKFIKETSSRDQEAILNFHLHNHGDSHNGFVMNREDKVKTISVTSGALLNKKTHFYHHDLHGDIKHEKTLQHP